MSDSTNINASNDGTPVKASFSIVSSMTFGTADQQAMSTVWYAEEEMHETKWQSTGDVWR